MSDEKMPYIKRLEEQLIRETRLVEAYLKAHKDAVEARYDRLSAAKKAEYTLTELNKEIENAKSLLGGKYA